MSSQIDLRRLATRLGERTLELANHPRRLARDITRADEDARNMGALLQLVNLGRALHYRACRNIFIQGEVADSLFVLMEGRVCILVNSPEGKQATLGIFHPGMFFGQSCLVENVRQCTARALTNCGVVRIQREEMISVLRNQQPVCEMFINILLRLQGQYQQKLVDQMVDNGKLRLVHALIDLAYAGRSARTERQVSGISQEILAELVGTTRARVSCFMTQLRKRGVIDYTRRSIWVHPSIMDLLKN